MSVLSTKKVTSMPPSASPSTIYFELGGGATRIKMYVTDISGTAFPVGIISEVDVLNTLLAGYAVGTNTPLASTNSILIAFQNVQGQLNALSTLVSGGVKVPLPIDCSTNPNYPAATAGDSYRVIVAGRIGGPSGPLVQVGDLITAITTNAGGTHAAVGSQWYILQANVDNATESVTGLTRIATSAEADALSEAFAYLTPLRVPQSVRNTPLTGYTLGANVPIVATDTVLQAFGKLQGQISNFTGTLGNYVTIDTAQTITGLKGFTAEIQSKVAAGTDSFSMFQGNTTTKTWGITNISSANYDFVIRRYGGLGDKNIFSISRAFDAVYFNSRVTIGSTLYTSSVNLKIEGDITGGTTSYGTYAVQTIKSGVTNSARVFQSEPSTEAAAFTISALFHFLALQGTVGAGSTITNQSGFHVGNNLIGATNNFGFRGEIPFGTNRWNLYMNGTATNHLAGDLWIGTTTGTNTLDVNGTARIRNLANYGTTPVDVLVPGPTGVLYSRTLAEFKADLGLQSGVTGFGVANQVTYWSGTNTVTGSDDFTFTPVLTVKNATTTSSLVLVRKNIPTSAMNIAQIAAIAYSVGTTEITAGTISFITEAIWTSISTPVSIVFSTTGIGEVVRSERWRITNAGILQSIGAQTIQTATGNLTLSTAAGNGNVIIVPHGTGKVLVGSASTPTSTLDVNGDARIRTIPALATTPTLVLVPNATGVVSSRTLAEFRTDLGVQTGNFVTLDTVQTITAQKTFSGGFIDTTTHIGQTNGTLVTLATNEWGTRVIGSSIFSNATSVGRPIGSTYGHYFIYSKRDTGGGYAGIYQDYRADGSGGFWIGGGVNSTTTPVWHKVWTDVNLPNPINGTGTINFVSKFTASGIGDSTIFDNGTNIGIGTITPTNVTGYRIVSLVGGVTGSSIILGTNITEIGQFHVNLNGATLISLNTRPLRFSTSATNAESSVERARFTTTGQFWIGTITGTNFLDVNGDARIRTIANLGAASTEVLVPNIDGVLSKRTLTEFKADLGLGGSVSGGAAAGQVTYWSTADTITGETGFTWNTTTKYLAIDGGGLTTTTGGLNITTANVGGGNILLAAGGAFKVLMGVGLSDTASYLTISRTQPGTNVKFLSLVNNSVDDGTGISIKFTPSTDPLYAAGAQISAIRTNIGGSGSTFLSFFTSIGGSLLEKVRISEAGQLWVGTTTGTNTLDVAGTARIRTLTNYGTTPAEVLVPGPTGVLYVRTLTEFKADLGLSSSVSGSGADGQVTYWNSTNTITGTANFTWINATNSLVAGSRVSIRRISDNGIVGTFQAINTLDFELRNAGGNSSYIQLIADSNIIFGRSTTTETWRITPTGVFQANGAQTIQTSGTTVLTLQPAGGSTSGVNITANVNVYSSGGTGVIRNTVSTGLLNIAGGNTSSDGANIHLYGSTHATSPSTFIFRTSTINQLTINSTVVDIPTDWLQARGGITNFGVEDNPIDLGPIETFTLTNGGSGYVDGTYTNVVLTTLNSAAYALFDITVLGSVVTNAVLKHPGTKYNVGAEYTATNTQLGGTGSGLIITVNTVFGADLYLSRTTIGSSIRLENGTTSLAANATLGRIFFGGKDATNFGSGDRAAIVVRNLTTSGGAYMDFETSSGFGTEASANRIVTMRLTTDAAKFVDGTPALPSISFISDQDTGIFSNVANVLSFATGGAEKWKITAATSANFESANGNIILNPTGNLLSIISGDIQFGNLSTSGFPRKMVLRGDSATSGNDYYVIQGQRSAYDPTGVASSINFFRNSATAGGGIDIWTQVIGGALTKDIRIYNGLSILTIANAVGDFVTRNPATGQLTIRTAAEIATDIGGVPSTRLISTNNGITGGGDLSIDRTHSLTGQALALHNLATNGIFVRTGVDTVAARTITSVGLTIEVTNGNGVGGNPNLEAQWVEVQW